jgi:3-phenylpropionate/trans-cinnamate dioxygenase ferredoxin reductase subunit
MAGRISPADDIHLATGSFEERRFAQLHGRDGRLVGVLGLNRPRHVMQYKTMIQNGASFEDAVAAEI